MYEDINEILEPVLPKLKLRTDDIVGKVREKYNNKIEKDVLQ
jgi:hypothetical protein